MCYVRNKVGGVVALEGNGQRPSHQGIGWKETETMYTLNHTEVHGVAYVVGTIADHPIPQGSVGGCHPHYAAEITKCRYASASLPNKGGGRDNE